MKKTLFLLAMLAAAVCPAQEGPGNPSIGGFSKVPNLDLPAETQAEPAIEPTVIREEHVSIPAGESPQKWQPSFGDVDKWIAWIKRPRDILLAKQQGKEFYAAIFLADGKNLVLASQPVNAASTPDQSYNAEMAIDRANGSDGADWKHRKHLQITCILHSPNVSPDTWYPYEVGWLVPVKKGYKGPLHVVIAKGKGGLHPIIDATVPWPVPRG